MTAKEAMDAYFAHKYEPIHPYPSYNDGFGVPCRCEICERNRRDYDLEQIKLLKQWRDSAKSHLLYDLLNREIVKDEKTVFELNDDAIYDTSKNSSHALKIILTIADEKG